MSTSSGKITGLNNYRNMAYNMKRLLSLSIIASLIICFSGCGNAEYSYSIASSDVYLAGEYMRGPSPRAIDVELILSSKIIKNGIDVNLDYYGTRYHGTVKDNQIIWDRDPLLVNDATIMKSTIETYNSGVKMNHSFKMNGYIVTGEIVQVYSPK